MLYRATNKAGNKVYISALNKLDAIMIALVTGFVRNENNCSLTTTNPYGISYYDVFISKGNDMTEVDTKSGRAACLYSREYPKGKWIVT